MPMLSDETIIASLKEAYKSGCHYLTIYSRRQDIGLMKCSRGVELGLLRFREIEIDDQETHWRYYWTDKAREQFK